MSYRLVYTNRAARDIAGLSLQVKEKLRLALEKYSASPLQYARKMADPAFGTYRFRIGDYRVIFDIRDNDIIVLRAGNRRDIYRKR